MRGDSKLRHKKIVDKDNEESIAMTEVIQQRWPLKTRTQLNADAKGKAPKPRPRVSLSDTPAPSASFFQAFNSVVPAEPFPQTEAPAIQPAGETITYTVSL